MSAASIRLLPALVACCLAASACARSADRAAPAHSLAGDWDVYVALGAKPSDGFEGWRRMGFAHFAGADSNFAGRIVRRAGAPMLSVSRVESHGDSVQLVGDGTQ